MEKKTKLKTKQKTNNRVQNIFCNLHVYKSFCIEVQAHNASHKQYFQSTRQCSTLIRKFSFTYSVKCTFSLRLILVNNGLKCLFTLSSLADAIQEIHSLHFKQFYSFKKSKYKTASLLHLAWNYELPLIIVGIFIY